MEKLRAALFDAGPVKTPIVAVVGWVSWSSVKGLLEAAILIATACIVLIHLSNALIRQWCPVRRQRCKDCAGCRFAGTIFCARCTSERDDL
ncbi:MAG: hypothetical protein ABFD89_06660 [Bryobacteraceae bacterium]